MVSAVIRMSVHPFSHVHLIEFILNVLHLDIIIHLLIFENEPYVAFPTYNIKG